MVGAILTKKCSWEVPQWFGKKKLFCNKMKL